MLFLGETGSAQCEIRYKNNALHVSGSKKAFLGYKLDSASEPNGIFAEWHIENDCLKLFNDNFGLFPIYYTNNPISIAFSSSISDLLEIDKSRQLDDAAIAVFLRVGWFIGDTTPFVDIKALPPGAQLQFSKEHFSLKSITNHSF